MRRLNDSGRHTDHTIVLSGRSRTLSNNARAGLDVARALAAVYVVAHHVAGSFDLPRSLTVLFSFGQEAVMVFFLLSGFVIFANEERRVAHPRGYYLRRLRRIYPPIILAIIVSTTMWATGLIESEPQPSTLFATLVSAQDIPALKPGVVSAPYLDNDPLWSLSYEVFFYLVFPVVMVVYRRNERLARLVVPLVSVVAYATYLAAPNHISLVVAYFLIWWTGAMAARSYLVDDARMGALQPEILGLAALCAVGVAGIITAGWSGIGVFPGLMLRHFALAGLLLLVLLSPLRRLLGAVSRRVAGPAAAVAGVSYGLYVLHYPILVQSHSARSAWIVPAVALLVCLAWVSDRALPRFLPTAPRT